MRTLQKISTVSGFSLFAGVLLTRTAAAATELISPIPGFGNAGTDLTSYLKAIFSYGIGLAALIAMGQLIFGAIQYTASAGAPSLQEDAKGRMRGAIVGLVLLLISTSILIMVLSKNPPTIEGERAAREERHPEIVAELESSHSELGENDIEKMAYSMDVLRDTNERKLVPWVEGTEMLKPLDYKDRLSAKLLDSSIPIETRTNLINALEKGIQTDSRYQIFSDTLKYSVPIAIYRVALLEAKAKLPAADFERLYNGLDFGGNYNAHGIGPDKD